VRADLGSASTLSALAHVAVAVLLVGVVFPIVWILLTGFETQRDAFSRSRRSGCFAPPWRTT